MFKITKLDIIIGLGVIVVMLLCVALGLGFVQ